MVPGVVVPGVVVPGGVEFGQPVQDGVALGLLEGAQRRQAGGLGVPPCRSSRGTAVATDRIASPQACAEMRDILLAQEKNDDLPSGLPAGTPVAHKNGWVDDIRHDAAIVYPPDAPPYLLVVCLSTPSPDEAMRRLMARIAAASWVGRHRIDSPS